MKRREAEPDWDRMTVSLAGLAKIFRVSESMVMKYARESQMPKGTEKGRYPLLASLWWREDRAAAAHAAEAESKDIVEERRKLIVSQRQHQELENAKMREEMLDASLVDTVIQQVGALIATQLDGLAPRLAPRLVLLQDQAAIQKMLYDECREIRTNASRAVSRYAATFAAGEDPPAPTQKKRRRVGRRKPDPAPGQSGAGPVAN